MLLVQDYCQPEHVVTAGTQSYHPLLQMSPHTAQLVLQNRPRSGFRTVVGGFLLFSFWTTLQLFCRNR